MSSSSDARSAVELLADEFLARCKRGEQPTIKEYCDRHPHRADEIRDVFEALLMVEDLKPGSGDVTGYFGEAAKVAGKRLEQVGDYRILCEIGRGGMGVVYEAEQQALGRRVALKVLPKSLAGDGSALIRFQREAKAAARMHHTNIVPVFDVGQDGEHLYYAMQLIHGQGLDSVIDDLKRLRAQTTAPSPQSLSLTAGAWGAKEERSIAASLAAGRFEQENLAVADHAESTATATYEGSPPTSAVLPGQSELSSVTSNRHAFYRSVAQIGVQTASALSYAHSRGIIHRDIKPGNLLLDTTGNVWVTDFGLAKTGDDGMTHTGDILGTVRYMAPERFRGQCDVRADIYALGMTLYEMLTLRAAYCGEDRLQLIELIRHSEPPSPRTIDARIPRDLETIVMKAIDKDAKRRYQSADEIGEDLQRFVNDEPIKARRIGVAERWTRWCRRNPAIAALAVAIWLVLLAGIAGTTWGLIRANQSAEAERRAKVEAETKRSEAEQARAAEARRAEGERLAKLDAEAKQAEAERQKARALEAQTAEAARAEGERLAKLEAEAKRAEAEQQKRRAEAGEKLARERLVEVQAAQRKADEANQVAQKVRHFFQHTVLGAQNLRKQASDEQLQAGGIAAEATANPTMRELLIRAAEELKPDKIEANFPKQPLLQAEFLWSVASTYRQVGEYELAIGFLERAVGLQQRHVGADHTITTHSMNELALAYDAVGKVPEAVVLWQHGYDARLKQFGPEDTGTLVFMHNLGVGYARTGRSAEGIALLERACAIRKRKFGADQPSTLLTLDRLAAAYRTGGNLPQAIASWEQLRDARVRLLGADHPATLDTRINLAGAYLAAGKPDLALPLVTETLAKTRPALPEERRQFAGQLARLAQALLEAKDSAAAEPLLRECLVVREKTQPDAWTTFNTQSMLGEALLGQKKYAEAEPLLLAGYQGLKQREETIPRSGKPCLTEAMERLARLYEATDRKDEAAKWRKELDTTKAQAAEPK